MPEYDETFLNLRFMTTFASMAAKFAGKTKSFVKSHPLFSAYVNSFADVYPALENLALSANIDFNLNLYLPKVDKNCTYDKVNAFFSVAPELAQKLSAKFPHVYPWYEFGNSEQLYAAKVNVDESSDKVTNKYWMNATLKLANTEILLRKYNLKYYLFESIDEALLPEKLAQLVQAHLYEKNLKCDDTDVAQILYEVGHNFLMNHAKVTLPDLSETVGVQLAKKYQVSENLTAHATWKKSMEQLHSIISSSQKKDAFFNLYERYLERHRKGFADALSDKDMLEKIVAGNKIVFPSETELNNYNDSHLEKVKQYEENGRVFEKECALQITSVLSMVSAQLYRKSSGVYDAVLGESFSAFDTMQSSVKKNIPFDFFDAVIKVARLGKQSQNQNTHPFICDDKTLLILKEKEHLTDVDKSILFAQLDAFIENYAAFRKNEKNTFNQTFENVLDDISLRKSCLPKLNLLSLMKWSYNEQIAEQNFNQIQNKQDIVSRLEHLHHHKFDYLVDYLDTAKNIFPECAHINSLEKAAEIDKNVCVKILIPFYYGQSTQINHSQQQNFFEKLFYDYARSVFPQHKAIYKMLERETVPQGKEGQKILGLGKKIKDLQFNLQKKSYLFSVLKQVDNSLENEKNVYSNYLKIKNNKVDVLSMNKMQNLVLSAWKERKK